MRLKDVSSHRHGSNVRNVHYPPQSRLTQENPSNSPAKRPPQASPRGRSSRSRRRPNNLTYDADGRQISFVTGGINHDTFSDITAKHIARHCECYFASYGIDHEVELPVTPEIKLCLGEL